MAVRNAHRTRTRCTRFDTRTHFCGYAALRTLRAGPHGLRHTALPSCTAHAVYLPPPAFCLMGSIYLYRFALADRTRTAPPLRRALYAFYAVFCHTRTRTLPTAYTHYTHCTRATHHTRLPHTGYARVVPDTYAARHYRTGTGSYPILLFYVARAICLFSAYGTDGSLRLHACYTPRCAFLAPAAFTTYFGTPPLPHHRIRTLPPFVRLAGELLATHAVRLLHFHTPPLPHHHLTVQRFGYCWRIF